MAFSGYVPTELLEKIISHVTTGDLPRLRLVSRSLYEIASRFMFETTIIDGSISLSRRIQALSTDDRLAHIVKQIVVDVRNENYLGFSPGSFFMLRGSHGLQYCGEFDSVERLCLKFNTADHNLRRPYLDVVLADIIIFRSDVFSLLFSALNYSRFKNPVVRHLKIQNLHSRCESHITRPKTFARFLRNLCSLDLSFCTVEYHVVEPIVSSSSLKCYDRIPATWLLPLSQNLRDLHIAVDVYWGFHPSIDFRHIYLPRLVSLELANFTFFDEWQLSWLLKHTQTLRKLRLLKCPLLLSADLEAVSNEDGLSFSPHVNHFLGYPFHGIENHEQHWAEYFRFMAESLSLQLFSYGDEYNIATTEGGVLRESELGVMLNECRYLVYLQSGVRTRAVPAGYRSRDSYMRQYREDVFRQKEELRLEERLNDWRALKDLMETVIARNGANPRGF